MATPTQTETQAVAAEQATTFKPRVFDRNKIYSIPVPHPDAPDGKKYCDVRYPSDKEWCQRAHRTVSVRKNIGGDGIRTAIPGIEAVNKELFDAIRKDQDGEPFDEYEATRVIDRLERCIVQDVVKTGVQYEIKMKAFDGSIVTHTLRIPTQRQLMDFGRAAIDIVGRKQAVETRVALEPSAALWKQVVQVYTGYSEPFQENDLVRKAVPVTHMDAAINELLARVNSDFEDTDPED